MQGGIAFLVYSTYLLKNLGGMAVFSLHVFKSTFLNTIFVFLWSPALGGHPWAKLYLEHVPKDIGSSSI